MAADKAKLNHDNREMYKAHGICEVCGQTWAEPGYVRCRACYIKAIASQRRRDPDGTKHKEYVKALRAQRKAAGLCTECGAPGDGIHAACKKCREKRNESKRIYRMRNRIREENAKCVR